MSDFLKDVLAGLILVILTPFLILLAPLIFLWAICKTTGARQFLAEGLEIKFFERKS